MEQLRMINKMGTVPPYSIDEGFSIRMYQPGDEVIWTDICKHGLLAEDEGIECWQKYMLDLKPLTPERDTFFVFDNEGNAIHLYCLCSGRKRCPDAYAGCKA